MAARRYYPSWLPPNPRERAALVRLRRKQMGVIAWLVALAPIGWGAATLTGSDALFVPLTLFWLMVGVTLAHRIASGRCPRCDGAFCAKQEIPYWYGLLNARCDNCGLTLHGQEDED